MYPDVCFIIHEPGSASRISSVAFFKKVVEGQYNVEKVVQKSGGENNNNLHIGSC